MAERVIESTDNMPPEALPLQLANAAEIPTMIKADIEGLTAEALVELTTYSRVPDDIADDGMYERATTLGTRLKAVVDKIEKRRKVVKQPYLDATTAIDTAFKLIQPAVEAEGHVEGSPERNLRKELDAAHAGIKGRLSAFDTKKFNEEEKRRQDERDSLAKAAAVDGITIDTQAPAPSALGSTRSTHGGSAVRKVVMDWSVVDEGKLPRSVLSVDPVKVQALIDAGATEIPGIELTRRVETHVKR